MVFSRYQNTLSQAGMADKKAIIQTKDIQRSRQVVLTKEYVQNYVKLQCSAVLLYTINSFRHTNLDGKSRSVHSPFPDVNCLKCVILTITVTLPMNLDMFSLLSSYQTTPQLTTTFQKTQNPHASIPYLFLLPRTSLFPNLRNHEKVIIAYKKQNKKEQKKTKKKENPQIPLKRALTKKSSSTDPYRKNERN